MLEHIGDILAIPFFAWLVVYFHSIPNKTMEETILYLFSIGGFLADILFTYLFFKKSGNLKIYMASGMYFFTVLGLLNHGMFEHDV